MQGTLPLGESNERERTVSFRRLVPEIPSTTYATFALYRYPAKFIPQVVAYVLKAYSRPGERILDPFAGYGTAGLVARLYGHPYELWDLNPLLAGFHEAATAKPPEVSPSEILRQIRVHRGRFLPRWRNLTYWHPEPFLEALSTAWDFYHQLDSGALKSLLLIPLLRVTRFFSYDDERVHKLYRSPRAVEKVRALLAHDWQERFYSMLEEEIANVQMRMWEYQRLRPRDVPAVIRAGVDTLSLEMEGECDLLVTSPPYLQAQEYIRTLKIDLFWTGFSESEVKRLTSLEIPYRKVQPFVIHSPTFSSWREAIQEPRLRSLFERYFWGVLSALTRLQARVRRSLCLFVGPATIRGQQVPIDRIFAEHFTALGWRHEATLIDRIVGRVMFRSAVNPATGLRDERMKTEHLVVLKRG